MVEDVGMYKMIFQCNIPIPVEDLSTISLPSDIIVKFQGNGRINYATDSTPHLWRDGMIDQTALKMKTEFQSKAFTPIDLCLVRLLKAVEFGFRVEHQPHLLQILQCCLCGGDF